MFSLFGDGGCSVLKVEHLLREPHRGDFAKSFFNLDPDCTDSAVSRGKQRRAATAKGIEDEGFRLSRLLKKAFLH